MQMRENTERTQEERVKRAYVMVSPLSVITKLLRVKKDNISPATRFGAFLSSPSPMNVLCTTCITYPNHPPQIAAMWTLNRLVIQPRTDEICFPPNRKGKQRTEKDRVSMWRPWTSQSAWWETRVQEQRSRTDPEKCSNWPGSNPPRPRAGTAKSAGCDAAAPEARVLGGSSGPPTSSVEGWRWGSVRARAIGRGGGGLRLGAWEGRRGRRGNVGAEVTISWPPLVYGHRGRASERASVEEIKQLRRFEWFRLDRMACPDFIGECIALIINNPCNGWDSRNDWSYSSKIIAMPILVFD